MVTISRESPVEVEARLRGVFGASDVTWLPGEWQYVEGDRAEWTDDPIAVVRDGTRVSALCPARPEGGQRFEVFRVVLPRGRDDSGFVGWLATRIKLATGAGILVVCGYDSDRGGVFDYYGVPTEAGPRVRTQISDMQDGSRLGSVVFKPVGTSPESRIGADTKMCLDLVGTSLRGVYAGGAVEDGWLVGSLSGHEMSFHYLQQLVGGQVEQGASTGRLSRQDDGRWQLTEHYVSTDGRTGTNRLESAGLDAERRARRS